jgi:hypothetical protein
VSLSAAVPFEVNTTTNMCLFEIIEQRSSGIGNSAKAIDEFCGILVAITFRALNR